MKAQEVEGRRGQRLPHRRGGHPGSQREPKLRVGDARSGVAVRVRIDAGCDAQQDTLAASQAGGELGKQRQLVEVIDDDPADAGLQGLLELVARLIVAMKVDTLWRKVDGESGVQLAAGDDIQAHAFFVEEPEEALIDECFAGVNSIGCGITQAKLPKKRAALRSQRRFVEDVERGAELSGQIRRGAAADG